MYKSIVVSCDTYYYQLANDLGIDAIAEFMEPFGFGRLTGIDLDGERKGILPSTAWKRKAYKRPELQKWYGGETVSVAIGQGYNSFTPLQLAHAMTVLVNDGLVYKPHLVKAVQDINTGEKRLTVREPSARVPLKAENTEFIRQAMVGVNLEGTSAKVFANAPFTSGGKTGTAQVFSLKANEKYDAKRVAERLRDHAWFVAFAPAENPVIALAVIVENGGFGAQAAAPIARTAINTYLSGQSQEAGQ
jgi:penicillin-binding protein 2